VRAKHGGFPGTAGSDADIMLIRLMTPNRRQAAILVVTPNIGNLRRRSDLFHNLFK
jgi:hypothetical protein